MNRSQHRSLGRHKWAPKPTHYDRAVGLMKDGKKLADAGKLEDALNTYLLAKTWLTVSDDTYARPTLKKCDAVIAFLRGRLGIVAPPPAAALAKTEPDDVTLGDIFPTRKTREEQEIEMDAADRRKAGGDE